MRLTEKAYNLGLIDNQMYADFTKEKELIDNTVTIIRADQNKKQELLNLFLDAEQHKQEIRAILGNELSERALRTVQAEILYEPYLAREVREIERTNQYKNLVLSNLSDYINLPGLSRELQEKLQRYMPATIAQAALIPGMTPAALSVLILKTRQK
jgi:tRNA uridine 5-carboxymethylaminomethyl modification enzyme